METVQLLQSAVLLIMHISFCKNIFFVSVVFFVRPFIFIRYKHTHVGDIPNIWIEYEFTQIVHKIEYMCWKEKPNCKILNIWINISLVLLIPGATFNVKFTYKIFIIALIIYTFSV